MTKDLTEGVPSWIQHTTKVEEFLPEANCDKHTLSHTRTDTNVENQWIYCTCLNRLEFHYMDMKCENTYNIYLPMHNWVYTTHTQLYTQTPSHTHTKHTIFTPAHTQYGLIFLSTFTDTNGLKKCQNGEFYVEVEWNQTSVEMNLVSLQAYKPYCFFLFFFVLYIYCSAFLFFFYSVIVLMICSNLLCLCLFLIMNVILGVLMGSSDLSDFKIATRSSHLSSITLYNNWRSPLLCGHLHRLHTRINWEHNFKPIQSYSCVSI